MHPKLKEVLHPDFADCGARADTLSGQDAAVYCLGAHTGAVTDAELEPRREPTFSYRLLRWIYPLFRALFPNQVIPADDLTRAMVDAVVTGPGHFGGPVFENREIQAMVDSV